ncbi:MAG: hypothetical protein JSR69_22025 [Proteobacteria bacterium]|nr:hypothetical protein [Pseudomonadota bacterium]
MAERIVSKIAGKYLARKVMVAGLTAATGIAAAPAGLLITALSLFSTAKRAKDYLNDGFSSLRNPDASGENETASTLTAIFYLFVFTIIASLVYAVFTAFYSVFIDSPKTLPPLKTAASSIANGNSPPPVITTPKSIENTATEPKNHTKQEVSQEKQSPDEINSAIQKKNYGLALGLIIKTLPEKNVGELDSIALSLMDSSPNFYNDPTAVELLKEVIKRTNSLTMVTPDGRVVWHVLLGQVQNNEEKFNTILDLLLSNGIDINQRDGKNRPLLNTGLIGHALTPMLMQRGACTVMKDPDLKQCQ